MAGIFLPEILCRDELKYRKPPLTIQDLVTRLARKGLLISNQSEVERFVQFIGYFRFRGYSLQFMRPAPPGFLFGTREFEPGTTFEDIVGVYNFDHALKGLVLDQLGRIEVAIRSVMIHELNIQFGSHWYMDFSKQLMSTPGQQANWFSDVSRDIHKSKEPFIIHYFNTYTDPILPPSWAIAECLTFGKWSVLYKHLSHGKSKIAAQFSLTPPILESWLHSLSVLRNTCAHHARLWDKNLPFTIHKHPKYQQHFNKPNRLYAFAAAIRILTNVIDGNNEFRDGLIALFSRQNKISPYNLWFPANWETLDIWK